MTESHKFGAARWMVSLGVIVLLALVAGLHKASQVPLDSHEIFVAQTVREMSQRGDWIVPYFNGAPRLNKPPMSYWAVAAVAALTDSLPNVQPIHARFVSVLAGIGLALATVATGYLLYTPATALVAGALVASSAGLFSFMHDARPDLLYAMWTAFMLVGAAWSARRPEGRGRQLLGGIGLLWCSMAAATLTKGPQLPALALVGWAVALRIDTGSWQAVRNSLKPLTGVCLVLLLTVPWWLMLEWKLGETRVATSQLGGTLLAPALSRLRDPYYLYRPLQLLLPWLPLFVFALSSLFIREGRRVAYLLWPLAIVCLGLSLGPQYRYFYVLPVMGLIAIFIAHGLVTLTSQGIFARIERFFIFPLQLLAVLACAGWVITRAGPVWLTCGAWLASAALVGAVVARYGMLSPTLNRYLALAAAMALVWPAAATTGALWNLERFDNYRLARLAHDRLDAATPLVTLGVSPTVYVYYAGKSVTMLARVEEISAHLAHAVTLGVVTTETSLPALTSAFKTEELGRFATGGSAEVLLRVELKDAH